MKRILCTIALLGLGVVGCNNDKKMSYGTGSNPSVTDVTAPVSTTPSYQPTPVPAVQPVVYDSMQPSTPGGSNSYAAGGNYTVKKGDTLYSIARSHYGDGKQWNKIASANPGLKPQSLRVGQTIVLP